MNWMNNIGRSNNSTTTTGAGAVTQPKPSATSSSPLAPAFERGKAKFQDQIETAMDESKDLAAGFKACLMEVGVANAKGSPMFYGYGTHKPMTMSLNKALPDNRLDLTVCLNVSGHDFKGADGKPVPGGQAMLDARAKDNKYVIQVTRPDGKVETMRGIEAKGALSTAQDISIKDMKPGKTIVEAWPEGSAGVGGYVEGRRLEINYNPPGGPAARFG
ncbi:MAG: hypothetical protein Q8O67_25285 [Deltaproteobacteria bacterium]|nr:hypothetical protein [Deltaproteobacteria bacterium]